MSKAPYMIVARRTITTMQDLKGKVIATSPPKGTPNALLAYFLARAGIDGGKDVSLLYIGSESARRTLVLTGQADAIIEDAKGGYELEEKLDSLHTLVPPSQMPPQLIVGLCTSDALIQSDPDMLRRMLRALAQANAFMRDNPGPTIALLATRLKTSHDVASRMTADVIPSLTSRLVPPRELFTAEAALDSASPGRAVTAAALEAIWDVALAREVDAERAAP